MKINKNLTALCSFFFLVPNLKMVQASETSTLVIVATGVKSEIGKLNGVLCVEGENFPNTCEKRVLVPAQEGTVMIEFENIPNGDYAFAAFHDENEDNVINFESHFPTEGLFFSQNKMGRMGPPSFKQSMFKLNGDKRILVQAKYLNRRN